MWLGTADLERVRHEAYKDGLEDSQSVVAILKARTLELEQKSPDEITPRCTLFLPWEVTAVHRQLLIEPGGHYHGY